MTNHLKLRKNDMVVVVAGKDRGRKGKVIKLFPQEHALLVEGLNMRKKHMKPRRSGEKGQVIAKEASITLANVKLLCPKCGKSTRVGLKQVGTKKVRVCKKCGQEIA
ncbi:MAG: 50S ribosomal protein L24 [Candidatus Wildermuthbacteria bacterium]|nr:50S ribosomal protein L24 [Candidatus Wildermuthbacteria bacterium]